jgi:MFS family permease
MVRSVSVRLLFALVALGDLSDHIGRKNVLAVAVACAAASTVLFLVASGIGVFVAARVVSGVAAGFATGTATAALAELQPRGDHRAAAVVASGSNMTGLGLGPLTAGIFAASAYVSGLAAAIVAVAFVMVLRTFGTAPAPEPPCAPSDGWCGPEGRPVRVRERARQ